MLRSDKSEDIHDHPFDCWLNNSSAYADMLCRIKVTISFTAFAFSIFNIKEGIVFWT